MQIQKRNGEQVAVDPEKIRNRVIRLVGDLGCDVTLVVQRALDGLKDGTTSALLDERLARVAYELAYTHPDYGKLAALIALSSLYKGTLPGFSASMEQLWRNSLVSYEFIHLIRDNLEVFSLAITQDRDRLLTYPEIMEIVRSNATERPQFFYMRRAIEAGGASGALALYDLFSTGEVLHEPKVSHYTLVEDSIDGIFQALRDSAQNSRYGADVTADVSLIRAKGSYVSSTNGVSNGLVPMLRAFDATAAYINGGGCFTARLDLTHMDLEEFLDLKKPNGKEEARARTLAYAVSVPSLFLERAQANGTWSLFCPKQAPGLHEAKGADFDALYIKYESMAGLSRKTVKAQEMLLALTTAMTEHGGLSIVFKDHSSAPPPKSVSYTINLSKFVMGRGLGLSFFNFERFQHAVHTLVNHAGGCVGLDGFSDALQLMHFPLESAEAASFNREVWGVVAACGALGVCTEPQEPPVSLFRGGFVRELVERGLWNPEVREAVAKNGSIQGIESLPGDIRSVYKLPIEIKQKVLVDLSAARSSACKGFTEPLHIHLLKRDPGTATSALYFAWRARVTAELSFKV